MDALNFLYQRPTVNWFDFYLDPSKLEVYENSEKPDPPFDVLIGQFCEQAKYEENVYALGELEKDDLEERLAKSKKLWLLALKLCAYYKWNTVKLRKNVSLVNLKRLVEEFSSSVWDTTVLAHVLTSTPNEEMDHSKKFACIFIARWVIDSYVFNQFPQPPPKITVSNPSTQSDPSFAFTEAKAFCVATLKLLCDVAVQFLEKILDCTTVDEYRMLSAGCFEIPAENSGMNIYLNLDVYDKQPVEIVKLQIKYDLGIYYFFAFQYDKAKACFDDLSKQFDLLKSVDGNYWTFDVNTIRGYCEALKIPVQQYEMSPSVICIKSPPSEQTAVVLLDNYKTVMPSTVVRCVIEETASLEQKTTVSAQIRSANIFRQIQKFYCITDGLIAFFKSPENLPMFCVALRKHVSSLKTDNERKVIKVYLNFLSVCVPNLRDGLTSCGLDNILWPAYSATRRVAESAPNLHLLQNLDGLWSILKCFDPAELKKVVSTSNVRKSSHHYNLQSSLSTCLGRVPQGPIFDLIILASCKAQQLIATGNVIGVSPLIDLIIQEFRAGINEVPVELNQECVRLELIRWHELAHRCVDVGRMSQITQELALKVKSFVTEMKKSNYPAPGSEISLLISAFLLNTCDWEYLIVHCMNAKHRFIDFAKLLAGLCHEFSKGGITRTVAKDFFDLLLPTMGENMRGQLLTRNQFSLMIKLIKEQMAITVLLSFFGKLFNCKQAGLTEIFVLHSSLWPATFTDASNVSDSYLKEVLTIILENGLIVNPNNAFWLRTVGDFSLIAEDFTAAIKYYLQSLTVCTDYFSKPLPDNIVDNKLILNLIKCCNRLECHTAEALFSQFMDQPNYNAAIKALQESTNYDGMDAYFPFIWDVALLEFLIANASSFDATGQQGRLEEAIRVLNQQELNIHNSPSVLYNVVRKRKIDFLSSLCCIFF